ncbi:hypothetical protein PVAP13_5NG551486 [Panicum virgatum]|uniref:Uncharacterized protein n=1 Tax=Panicum virgatum TaxID=38727 RepID=A0A8T0S083_PANVG|nr:hypothetical protein PVAP13_5NG551486 [Panicum virgatum]
MAGTLGLLIVLGRPRLRSACDTYREVDVPCLCFKVDEGIEEIISMPRVVYVASYCKRPFAPGTSAEASGVICSGFFSTVSNAHDVFATTIPAKVQ